LTTRKNTRPAGDSRAGVNDRKGDTKLTKIANDTKARLRRATNPNARLLGEYPARGARPWRAWRSWWS